MLLIDGNIIPFGLTLGLPLCFLRPRKQIHLMRATVTDLPLVPLRLYQFDRVYAYKLSNPNLTSEERRRLRREWMWSSPAQVLLDEDGGLCEKTS